MGCGLLRYWNVRLLRTRTFLVGFSGAWLAFSGLESISQLSPAMRKPIQLTARNGMFLVIITVLITSPFLALFSVALLPETLKLHETERFISELGAMWGGVPVKLAVVSTASVLLLFASNTGIIGAYHVFLALANGGFLPQAVTWRNIRLIEEAITREKGLNGNAIYVLYVEERPGLFVGSEAREPSSESRETLRFAAKTAQQRGFELIPIWTVSYNAAEAIARAARVLAVDTVMMGVSRRNAVYHLLRGHVVNGLTRRLPQSCHLLLHS